MSSPTASAPAQPLAHRVQSVTKLTGTSRTMVYEALKNGQLEAVKFGRATLILDSSVRRWLANLPRYTGKHAA